MTITISKPAPVYGVVENGGYAVTRDSSPMKTPAGHSYVVPSRVLAEAIAEEWRSKTVTINPQTMPFTQLAATTLDRTRQNREAVIGQITAYAHNELLCHRADEPLELMRRQERDWQPFLHWVKDRFGITLLTGSGILPVAQTPEAVAALHAIIASYDDFTLTGLQEAVSLTGSLVLGLALVEGHTSADAALNAAELEQLFQSEKWGDDPVTHNRHQSIRSELEICVRWFEGVKASGTPNILH